MKFSLKSIFGFMSKSNKESNQEKENLEYDKSVDFYYTNLINSLILFSLSSKELEQLSEPAFDPIFELESEIDYAFTPVCFETIFRNGLIDNNYKQELLNFKSSTDNIPSKIWDYEFIDNHENWITIREKANELLDKLGIAERKYKDDYTTIYDKNGNIIKKGKKL
jgi:hypothetical protein